MQETYLFGLLFLLALWVFPWKAVALWKAAKRDQKKWFVVLYVVNTFGLLEIIYIFFVARKKKIEQKTV